MNSPDETSIWQAAQELVAPVGQMPGSFTALIRFLRQDAEKNNNALGKSSLYELQRLLRAPSFLAPMAFAWRAFRGEGRTLPPKECSKIILASFTAEEFASLTFMTYLFRRIKRLCPGEAFEQLEPMLHVVADLSGLVGQSMKSIGFARGVSLATLPVLCSALFAVPNTKAFVGYRRGLKKSGSIVDAQAELSTWGCTHAELTCLVLQIAGLGRDVGEEVRNTLLAKQQGTTVTAQGPALWIWIKALATTGTEPSIPLDAKYYPLPEPREALLKSVNLITQNRGPSRWLARAPEDLGQVILDPSEVTADASSTEGIDDPFEEEIK